MEFLSKLYTLVTSTMETPTNYGWFHLVCIGTMILVTVLVCLGFRRSSDEAVNRLVAAVWLILVVFEVYKQLIFGFSLEDGRFVWDYAWYAFPFQFCSSPLYILPIIAFTRNERVRDFCIAYMMTFSLFAGLAVFCYPNDVFISTIGINIQTMVHHGSQIVMGIFFAIKYRDKFSSGFFFGGALVFVIMSFIAMALNIGVYHAFGIYGIDETFNMFYISPYFECTLPVLNTVWEKLPYPAFAATYFFGFILVALIVYGVLALLIRGPVYVTHRLPTKGARIRRHIC